MKELARFEYGGSIAIIAELKDDDNRNNFVVYITYKSSTGTYMRRYFTMRADATAEFATCVQRFLNIY